MASYSSQMAAPRPFQPSSSLMAATSNAPAGTFLPGTKVQVGNQRVVIDRYLSEGGFAHVYVVSLPKPVDGHEKAVLKRVAVPDKENLANMRTEVETMKRLRGRKYIVKYIDSHASSLKQGGYEVFLLMEWCNGGGLIDFMNTRLQNRLTEPEIVKIFTDVAEGVACMHYLSPPLMHRDIKVENVLITLEGKTKTFKLCDFGSAAPARPAATNAAEGRLIEDDIQRHTTLQYRSPEMIDVWRKQPIDEKSDVWALGCFLYKLCYYTTPFEEVGQMAILNASFKYPGYPKFSDDLKLLIASMLRESPSQRPNIYQVLAKACKMDGRPLSLRDNYTGRTQSEDTRNQHLPQPASSQSRAGASLAPPKPEAAPAVPQIEPMRRGRPTKPVSHHNSAKPSPSPLRILDHSDPHHIDAFSGLDHTNGKLGDDLSSKYPKLEEFSLMSDHGSKFAFEHSSKPTGADPDLAKRVTEALADEAFARPRSPPKQKPVIAPKPEITRTLVTDRSELSVPKSESLPPPTALPQRSRMVDHGTSASPPPAMKHFTDRPVWKVPEKSGLDRSATVTQASSRTKPVIAKDKAGPRLSSLLREDAARSQLGHDEGELLPPASSRPSLEGGRPLLRELDSGVHRSRSLNMRTRPVSVNMGAHPTHIQDHEIKRAEIEVLNVPADMSSLTQTISDQHNNLIESDLDFLRAREEEERERHKHFHRLSGGSKHHKRSSLPSAAITGTKDILTGRFGDAFRMFEGHKHGHHSPTTEDPRVLTPIAGSEATDLSDDRRALDETEELSPELRRELEKQKLEAEERRVERAAAEYRQRIATKGAAVPPPPASAKAASIQNRVQSLLQENEKPAQRTATGYGRFTPTVQMQEHPKVSSDMPVSSLVTGMQDHGGRPLPDASQVRAQRPSAPPKPQVLRTTTVEDALGSRQPVETVPNGDDWEEFSNKYPSLSHLEMAENDHTSRRSQPPPQRLRMKEV